MHYQFPISLFRDSRYQKLGISARFLLHIIYSHMVDGEGSCWPSIKCLSEYTGQCRRMVQRAKQDLIKNGLIIEQARPGYTSILTPVVETIDTSLQK